MLEFITIAVVFICLGTIILFLSKGKKKYVLMLNYGSVLLIFLIPILIDTYKILTGTLTGGYSNPLIFSILGIVGQVFYITIAIIALLLFPLILSLISSGIYRIITLPKNPNY